MSNYINCDDANFPENISTDICDITKAKWQVTGIMCCLLLGVQIYMQHRWKYRSYKTLLTFHNLRSALTLLLLAINTLELVRAFLPWPENYSNTYSNSNNKNLNSNYTQANNSYGYGRRGVFILNGSTLANLPLPGSDYQQQHFLQQQQQQQQQQKEQDNNEIIVIVGTSMLLNALLASIFTIVLLSYHRIVELKNAIAFLYGSAIIEFIIFILRVYELAEVTYERNFFELEPSLHALCAICLLSLCVTDGVTIYKERYRPVYFEDYEKIGYKHTLATFYSKACFWWLTPLLWFGYKEPLELEDLGQLRVEDSARAYYDQFLLTYKTAKLLETGPPPSLWLCYLVSSWRMFTLGGLLKLFGDLFALIGPLAIQQIVQYIETMYTNAAMPELQQQQQQQQPQMHNTYNYSNNNNNNNNIDSSMILLQGLLRQPLLLNRSMRATGSITNLNPYNNDNNIDHNVSNNNIYYTNLFNNNNNYNNYNETANDIVGADYIGADVQIYYATWLDLVSNGWAIAWIVLLAALAQGGLSQASTHILNMTGIRIKTSLQGLIYRKTLLLNSSCIYNSNNNNNNSEQQYNNNKNVNNNDTDSSKPMTEQQKSVNVNGTAIAAEELQQQSSRLSSCEPTIKSEQLMTKTNNFESNENQQQQKQQENVDSSINDNIDNGGSTDIGAITNLMSEDTLNVMSFFWIAHYVWAIPLKIGVVMYLLYLKLGISAVIGSFVCILTVTPLQFLIGKAMSSNTEVMAKYTDERLRKIHDTFCGIKLIKLNAWDDVFLKKIRTARAQELRYLNKDSVYWTLMTILTHVSSVLITFVTLAFYVRLEDGNNTDAQFTASTLFSALALFQQLTVPLLIFPITVPIIIAAVISTRRIERFLLANEVKKEFQGIRNMARILSKSDASLDMYEGPGSEQQSASKVEATETENISTDQILAASDEPINDNKVSKENALNEKLKLRVTTIRVAPLAQSEPQTPLIVNEMTAPPIFTIQPPSPMIPPPLTPPSLISHPLLISKDINTNANSDCNECNRKALLRNTPYVIIRPNRRGSKVSSSMNKVLAGMYRDSLLLKMPEGVAVSLRQAHFSWDQRRKGSSLFVSEVDIPKARLTIIVGKNGSGKSSLLAAMLMEMPHKSGDLIWNKTSTFAYVPQQSWLLNASIRQNIIFGENFRPRRYEFVLKACALKPDIELMPDGDFTVIGERGINLSGGQRQRIAIARALYSSANVVIMDDPLSSLDNEVARHIFEQSIRKMLLKANRTVILVTQQLNLVRQADYLIVMKDGKLQAAGSYKDIEEQHPNIVKKWNAIIAKANEKELQNASAIGRTARERWKLFKNVTKMGLQRSISTLSSTSSVGTAATTEIDEEVTTENNLMPATMPSHGNNMQNYPLTRKRSSYYGSRHLIYDVPLPIDECQTDDVIIRRNPRRRRTDTINSRSSSRRSVNSSSCNSGEWNRRSLLTASCSSAASYASNQTIPDGSSNTKNTAGGGIVAVEEADTDNDDIMTAASMNEEKRKQRIHSWQPQTSTSLTTAASSSTASGITSTECLHQKLSRNISSPSTFQRGTGGRPLEDKYLAAAMAASADMEELREERQEEERIKNMGSFQQFMRRMSARRSNISKGNRSHRPLSATNSILSISEESASMPSIELKSIATETSSWMENIEDEEPISEANIDYSDTLKHQHQHLPPPPHANNENDEYKMNDNSTTINNICTPTSPTAVGATIAVIPSTEADVERKYGKIPAQIYLLYLRASGYSIVLTFFTTALIWQSLRVYTDVWLRNWTDDNGTVSDGIGHTYANETKSTITDNSSSSSIIVDSLLSPTATSATLQQHQHEVTYYFQVYAFISCICILMAMLSTPAGQMAGCNARRNLHDQLLSAIMRKSLHFFQVTPLGRLMNRFSNDMAIIDKKIAATSQRLLQFTLLCLCAMLINVIVTPWFIILTVPICVAYYAIQKFYRSSSRELQRIENITNTPVISHLSETIQGVTTIRAYNQEARFTEILFRRLEANTIAFTILNTSNRWLGISLDYLGGVIVFVAIVTALCAATYSCHNLKLQTTFQTLKISTDMQPSPSLVGLAINYTLLIPIYLNWVVKLLADMEMYVGSVERIAYYTEEATAVEIKTKEVAHAANEYNIVDELRVIHNDDAAAAAAAVDVTAALNDVVVVVDGPTAVKVAAVENKDATSDDIERNDASFQRVCNGVKYKTVPISWPQRGDISFENVSLRYEGQQNNVITNLTLKIPAGQKIGICGRTGSGKSSIALSLFGVLQTTGGRILIDNVDITQIHPDEIRSRLSIIPQDVHLFNATIRENLDPPGYYSDLALWNCLELAQLKEFVNSEMPNGLDTEILDGGLNLSSGHRQLFCLARAILRGSVCLVLDEATSSLDSTTERALLNAAYKAFQGRTIVTIAHRLSTILNYDRIIVLENGTIVEDGSPQELQTEREGIFRSMLHSGRPISLASSDTGVFSSEQYL